MSNAVESYAHAPEWPIAVYQSVDGQIPFAPFVAYPMIPTVGKKGERGLTISVRCPGQTADEARDAARAWIAAEIEKSAKNAESRRAAVAKRVAALSKAEG